MSELSRRSFFRTLSAGILAGVPVGASILSASPAAARAVQAAPGSCCHTGKRRLVDAQTGREVWQMTAGECNSWVPYMYVDAFSPDDRYLIFNSDRSGRPQLYRMEVEAGEAIQFTYFEDYGGRHVMDPSGREVYFTAAGPRVWAVEIESGRARQVADLSALTERLRGLTRTGDGRHLLVTFARRSDGLFAMARIDSRGDGAEEAFVFNHHPRRGRIERVSHPQANPTHPHLVSVVLHPDMQGGYPYGLEPLDLPDEMRARAWLVDLEAGTSKPFLVMEPGFRATHEYWAPDGGRMYFHRKAYRGFLPASIGSIPLGGGPATYYIESDTLKLGHSAVHPHLPKILSDIEAPHRNALLLIDLPTGDHDVICWPNTSGNGDMNHTHPSFSRTGRYGIYTSDAGGNAQVYMVDLEIG